MPDDHKQVGHGSRVARCAVTNGKGLHLFGDGRSAGARRYRDLLNAYAAELGGMATLGVVAQQTVRRLAQISVELELLEAQRASGETIDPVAYCSGCNVQRRLLRDLERIKPVPRQPTLAEMLVAEKRAREMKAAA